MISARGAETVFFRYAARTMMQIAMTMRLTTEDRMTVRRIWRLASVPEMPAKINPLMFPAASLVGT